MASQDVDEYEALPIGDFPLLRHLSVRAAEDEDGIEISLEMSFHGAGAGSLVVRCSGIRDLVFRQPWTSDLKLHRLMVDDVSESQWEGVAFKVRDLEEECLSFACRTFGSELVA